jgi:hypothetical protein
MSVSESQIIAELETRFLQRNLVSEALFRLLIR